MIISVAVLLTFTIIALASFQLQYDLGSNNQMAARMAAEDAINETIYNLGASNFQYGTAATGLSGLAPDTLNLQTVQVTTPAGVGLVTFDHTSVHAGADVPWSLNNYGAGSNVAAVPGFVASVPPASVDIIGTGYCGNIVHSIEVVVHVPPFPYAVATRNSGAFVNSLIGAATDLSSLRNPDGSLNINPAQLTGGNVGSDGSLTLDDNTVVGGNAQSTGSVTLRNSVVNGAVLENANSVAIPTIEATTFDPGANNPALTDEIATNTVPNLNVSGTERADHDLTVSGSVVLNSGVLYVNGSLAVQGSLQGTGAIIASGGVSVQGQTIVDATDTVAVLADGDVNVTGASSTTANFQGVVYSGGTLSATHISLFGTFIGGNSANILDSNVVWVPSAAQVYLSGGVGISQRPATPLFSLVPLLPVSFGAPPSTAGAGTVWNASSSITAPWVIPYPPPPYNASGTTTITELTASNNGGTLQYQDSFINPTGTPLRFPPPPSNPTVAVTVPGSYPSLLAFQNDQIQNAQAQGGTAQFAALMTQVLPAAIKLLPTSLPAGVPGPAIVFDPNVWLQPSDQLRIVVWKDL